MGQKWGRSPIGGAGPESGQIQRSLPAPAPDVRPKPSCEAESDHIIGHSFCRRPRERGRAATRIRWWRIGSCTSSGCGGWRRSSFSRAIARRRPPWRPAPRRLASRARARIARVALRTLLRTPSFAGPQDVYLSLGSDGQSTTGPSSAGRPGPSRPQSSDCHRFSVRAGGADGDGHRGLRGSDSVTNLPRALATIDHRCLVQVRVLLPFGSRCTSALNRRKFRRPPLRGLVGLHARFPRALGSVSPRCAVWRPGPDQLVWNWVVCTTARFSQL